MKNESHVKDLVVLMNSDMHVKIPIMDGKVKFSDLQGTFIVQRKGRIFYEAISVRYGK